MLIWFTNDRIAIQIKNRVHFSVSGVAILEVKLSGTLVMGCNKIHTTSESTVSKKTSVHSCEQRTLNAAASTILSLVAYKIQNSWSVKIVLNCMPVKTKQWKMPPKKKTAQMPTETKIIQNKNTDFIKQLCLIMTTWNIKGLCIKQTQLLFKTRISE